VEQDNCLCISRTVVGEVESQLTDAEFQGLSPFGVPVSLLAVFTEAFN